MSRQTTIAQSYVDLLDWFSSLEGSFVFLLAMPLLVACAGLGRYLFDEYRMRHREEGRRD